MLDDDKIKNLNSLARKKKENNISESEMRELTKLRKEYLSNFRNSFRNHIESTKVIDPEGNDVTPQKVKDIKAQKNNDSDKGDK
ncbi:MULTISPECIES: DUF896 domain-containing protein [Jeotgalicoccus]|uniref:DUF896 domain-containing protein n=1 Tax=Jeotgalicoccus TaxID=227979 RepID=UPI000411CCFF|nr:MULTISPECIES: DUF896 domain-containing protein [Jeotgalicoccus]